MKKEIHEFTEDTNGTSGFLSMGTTSYDSDTKKVNDTPLTSNEKLEALMDEAKTMISLGSYNDNIVNLQGVSFEADHKYDTLKDVSLWSKISFYQKYLF